MATPSTRPLAIVTGASSGIGFELARQFVDHHFDVIIAAEDEGIFKAADMLKGKTEVTPVRVDLAKPEGVEDLYKFISANGRVIDSIAINAGVGLHGDFARETRLEDELNLINLNVTSSVHLAKLVLKDMVANRHGRALITASIAALMPGTYSATYNASKAFLLLFAEALHQELKGTGVTVTALMPGATETNFFHRAGMDATKIGQAKKDSPADVARDGFEAMMRGEEKVIAHSMKTKAHAALSEILPSSVTAALHAKQQEEKDVTRH